MKRSIALFLSVILLFGALLPCASASGKDAENKPSTAVTAFEKAGGAFNTFACSYDLIRWTRWTGPPLIAPTESWENVHAHKPWLIRHEGVNYHFYCAVNNRNERFIAVAHS